MHTHTELIRRYATSSGVSLPEDACPRLNRLTDITAVVFDVYGTLFSSSAGDISLVSKENRDSVMISVLGHHGIELLTGREDPALHKRFLDTIEQHQEKRRKEGVSFPEVEIRAVWKDFFSSLESGGIISSGAPAAIEEIAIEFECRVNPVQVMPGMQDCLLRIKDSGRVMGIISNAQFYTPLLFNSYLGSSLTGLGFCEDVSVWSYRLLEGKPSQRLYRIAAQQLLARFLIQPEQVLYIGNDIRNDIWPAQACGFRTALFAGDALSLRRRKDDPECKDIMPDLEITHLSQILDCLR